MVIIETHRQTYCYVSVAVWQYLSNLCVDLWSFVVGLHVVREVGELLPSQEHHVACICK